MGSQILASILQGVIWFLNIFTWLIIINALLSWIISPKHLIRIFIGRMVAPFLAPFRALTKGFRSVTFPNSIFRHFLPILFANNHYVIRTIEI